MVHGVGNHTEDSFKDEVTATLGVALAHYREKPNDMSTSEFLAQYVDIQCIDYNYIFKRIYDRHVAVSEDLNGTSFAALSALTAKLTDIYTGLSDDGFITSHVFDALLYQSFVKEAIDCAVAAKLGKILSDAYNQSQYKIHILGHSLGTAVVHNVLHKSFKHALSLSDIDGAVRQDEDYQNLELLNQHNKFYSITTVANCAPWFQHAISPIETGCVKPGNSGCCDFYLDLHHHLDPVCAVNKFDVGTWSSDDKESYKKVSFSDVVNVGKLNSELGSGSFSVADIHSIQHYLSYPKCHAALFDQLGIHISQSHVNAAMDLWKEESVAGSYDDLKEKLEQLSIEVDIEDGVPNLQLDTTDLKQAWLKFATFFKG